MPIKNLNQKFYQISRKVCIQEKPPSKFSQGFFSNISFSIFLFLLLLILVAGLCLIQFKTVKVKTLPKDCITLIDPSTPMEARTKNSVVEKTPYRLIFSDEFNVENRKFTPGNDRKWTSRQYWNHATQDQEIYTHDSVSISQGLLHLDLNFHPDSYTLKFPNGNDVRKLYTGAQIESWNKFCFTGGKVEIRAKLPGNQPQPGYWPALWMLGNLGRVGNGATLDGTFPYSYNSCDQAAFPSNASTHCLRGQRINACVDTWPADLGMAGGTGRGVPEFDILEYHVGENNGGEAAQSIQLGPKNPCGTPDCPSNSGNYFRDVSLGSVDAGRTLFGSYLGNPYQDSITVSTLLKPSHSFHEDFHTFGLEWFPGNYVAFLLDDQITAIFHQSDLAA
eukprot:Sdes_comp15938_c0_seq1m5083